MTFCSCRMYGTGSRQGCQCWRAGQPGPLRLLLHQLHVCQTTQTPAPVRVSRPRRPRPPTKTLQLLWRKHSAFIPTDQRKEMPRFYCLCYVESCRSDGEQRVCQETNGKNTTTDFFYYTCCNSENFICQRHIRKHCNLPQRSHIKCIVRSRCMSKRRDLISSFFSKYKAPCLFLFGLNRLWFHSICHFKVKTLCCATA